MTFLHSRMADGTNGVRHPSFLSMPRQNRQITPEEVVQWVRESTVAQGLPEKVTDPTVLRKVAILMRPQLALQNREAVQLVRPRRKDRLGQGRAVACEPETPTVAWAGPGKRDAAGRDRSGRDASRSSGEADLAEMERLLNSALRVLESLRAKR